MTHRCIARIAGAAILGAGLLLGGTSPALATDTGPDSTACRAGTDERDFRQDPIVQPQAANFDRHAQQHDADAAAADELAANKQAAADQADDRATRRQAAANEADERANRKQNAAEQAEANGNLERRDQYREEAEQARINRDQYRDEAAASRENRDQFRAEAGDARAEREDARAKAEDARTDRDEAKAACAEPKPPGDTEQPGKDDEDKTPSSGDKPGFIDKDCAELTGDQAQAMLDEDRSDPHRLDADKDGLACERGGGQEDTSCSNIGVTDDSGHWVWDCEQWVQVSDTDDGSAPKDGDGADDGDTGKLVYTGAGNALGWLAGGLGLVGAGALALALGRTRPVLRGD